MAELAVGGRACREIPLGFTNNSVGYQKIKGNYAWQIAVNKLGKVLAEMHYIIHDSCMVVMYENSC